jgi:hypothetical protein
MSAHLSRLRLFQRHLRSLVWVWVWVWDWIHSHTPPRTRSPSSRHPTFTHYHFPLRSLVCGGQPSPHKPRLVVSHSTCPPLFSSPHAHSFVLGTAVRNTHASSLPRLHNSPLAKCGCKKFCMDFHGDHTTKDPYHFYRVLKVGIKATLPQIEVAYRKISMYHPDRHATDKTVWTAQFQIPTTIKSTLTNTEKRQKKTVNLGRPLRMPSVSVDVEQRLHRMESGDTYGNAKQRLHLRRGRAAEPSMPLFRQMQTRLHHTEPAVTRRKRL